MAKLTGKARIRDKQRNNRRTHQSYLERRSSLRKLIRIGSDPVLTQVCTPVEQTDDLSFIDTMVEVLKATDDGVGLAAPQIGITKNVIVFRSNVRSEKIHVMINPLIIRTGHNTVSFNESCLSFPGVTVPVERYSDITVNWKTDDWHDEHGEFLDVDAVIIQHEVGHTNGICDLRKPWLKKKYGKGSEIANELGIYDDEPDVKEKELTGESTMGRSL